MSDGSDLTPAQLGGVPRALPARDAAHDDDTSWWSNNADELACSDHAHRLSAENNSPTPPPTALSCCHLAPPVRTCHSLARVPLSAAWLADITRRSSMRVASETASVLHATSLNYCPFAHGGSFFNRPDRAFSDRRG